jgi:hypothetical protein
MVLSRAHQSVMKEGVMRRTWVVACLAACTVSTSAQAVLSVPPGVAPGESYQLAFVTSVGTHATSSDINFYNALVQAAADAAGVGGGTTWSAIASTAAVDANANAPVSTKVFNLHGELLATGYSDYWDGTHAVGAGIDYNEYGIGKNTNVWTGSHTDGTRAGNNVLGQPTAVWGESTFSSGGWINHGTQSTAVSYSLYALSQPLTAPVPEPHSWAMLLLGVALIGAMAIHREPT